jgi:thiamine biosynthesis lipoprotein
MAIVRLARHAMATRFEIVLLGDDPVSLRAAGEEAFDEIERLESQLSLYRPTSEIAHLNARAAYEPVRVTPATFGLLQHAQKLTQETKGAFDITIAPLVRCWGFMGGSGRLPGTEDLAAARAKVGMHLVHLDRDSFRVKFEREGVMLDLGAIGKGYAIEQAVELLREAGVSSAFIHGGTSTLYGLGHPPGADSWKVEIVDPRKPEQANPRLITSDLGAAGQAASDSTAVPSSRSEVSGPFATIGLCDASLSVSAVWGKSFTARGRTFGHIIDPRSGEPANRAVLAAVALPSATETDALSTALLTLGPQEHGDIAKLRPGMRTLVAGGTEGGLCVKAQGLEPRDTVM